MLAKGDLRSHILSTVNITFKYEQLDKLLNVNGSVLVS